MAGLAFSVSRLGGSRPGRRGRRARRGRGDGYESGPSREVGEVGARQVETIGKESGE